MLKPIRKQKWFRETVIAAYGGQCALCEVSEEALLRAAHILDVADGGPDEVSNGICFCVKHEVAFDRGRILITPELEVLRRASGDIGSTYSKLRVPQEPTEAPAKEMLRAKYEKMVHQS